MGKKTGKKGKKGKKGGNKGGKKGKKAAAPRMTFEEAILAYKINLLEKKLEDVSYEVKGWEEKNERGAARNVTLKEERDALANHTLQQMQAIREKPEETFCCRDDVTVTLKALWDYRNQRREDTDVYEVQVKEKEAEIEEVRREVESWGKYREGPMGIESMEIRLLEQELRDLDETFGDMIEFIEGDMKKTKDTIQDDTNQKLAKQKGIASDKAMLLLDKYSLQEVRDNEWLQIEVQTHTETEAILEQEVANIEKQNLEIMSRLFDCRADDLKIYKSFYMTQIDENDDLENMSILEMDIASIDRSGELTSADLLKRAEQREEFRPKSTTLKAIEDKLYPLLIDKHSSEEESDDDREGDSRNSVSLDILDQQLFLEDSEDCLNVGSMELKMLTISGVEATLHPASQNTTTSTTNSEWPITHKMIQNAVMPNS